MGLVRSIRIARLVSLVGALLLVGACGGRSYVDGYPIGDRQCTDAVVGDWLCDGLTAFGTATLDERAPGHAPVSSIEVYRPDFRTADGGHILHTRGTAGGDAIVVIRLADATVRAFYVSCIAGPWGDGGAPPPDAVHCDLETPMAGES